MAARLRTEREFSSVNDGEDATADRDRDFLFEHRYVLSEAVDPAALHAGGPRGARGKPSRISPRPKGC